MAKDSNSGGGSSTGNGQGGSTPATIPELPRPVTTFVRDLPPNTIQKKSD